MIGSTMNETPCFAQPTFGYQRFTRKRFVNDNAMESLGNASQMPRYREFRGWRRTPFRTQTRAACGQRNRGRFAALQKTPSLPDSSEPTKALKGLLSEV
jgi:hypothetical protein